VAKELKISLGTGRIEVPDVPGDDASDEEKNDATLALVADLDGELAELAELARSDPRACLRQLWVLDKWIEAFPVRWIRNYAQRQPYTEVQNRLKGLRQQCADALGIEAADQLWSDLDYVREILPRLYTKFRVRGEVLRLILTPLGKLKYSDIRYQRDDPEDLSRLCQDIAQEIRKTAGLDDEVRRWGPENYPALLEPGAAPARLPPGMVDSAGPGWAALLVGLALAGGGGAVAAGQLPGGLVAGLVAAAIGLVALGFGALRLKTVAQQRAAAPERFKDLAERFRERLYLITALRVLNQMASEYMRAADGFKSYVRDHGGPPRWKTIKFDGRDLTQVFVDSAEEWHEKETVEHWLSERVKQEFRLDSSTLAAPEDLDAQTWEVILRAYLLESMDESSSEVDRAVLLDTVADLVFKRRGEATERERVFNEVYAAWDRMAG